MFDSLVGGAYPDARGRFGTWGGSYVPETLCGPLRRLTTEAGDALTDPGFIGALDGHLGSWVGRPTPLTRALRLSQRWGVRVWLKREDLAHTGAHCVNNALGQGLLAARMGAERVVAETGGGAHGVAAAAVCARLGLGCRVFVGARDAERRPAAMERIAQLGAEVTRVAGGTVREALLAAIAEWSSDPQGTYFMPGSAVGPHPYPWLVRELQVVVGREARAQVLDAAGALPDAVFACVGGGGHALGLFTPFLRDADVELFGVEAGGTGDGPGAHAATLARGAPGVLHGAMTMVLQDGDGQVLATHSAAAGLAYPGVGPEHALLSEVGRAQYTAVSDAEVEHARDELCSLEGIAVGLEAAHAVAGASRWAADHPGRLVLVACSGAAER